MTVHVAIGIVIKEIRKDKGSTIQQISTMTDIPEFTIVHVEDGNQQITVKQLFFISHALGCHPRSIINLSDRLLEKFKK